MTAFPPLHAQISYERILQAEDEPESWLTYNGSYMSQRYSRLTQIDQDNLGGQIVMAPITYRVDGVQYLTFISGHVLASFALPED